MTAAVVLALPARATAATMLARLMLRTLMRRRDQDGVAVHFLRFDMGHEFVAAFDAVRL